MVEGVDFEVGVEEGDGEFGVSVVFEGFVVEFVVEEFDGEFEEGLETGGLVVLEDEFVETEGEHEPKIVGEDLDFGVCEFVHMVVSKGVLSSHPIYKNTGTEFGTGVNIKFLVIEYILTKQQKLPAILSEFRINKKYIGEQEEGFNNKGLILPVFWIEELVLEGLLNAD